MVLEIRDKVFDVFRIKNLLRQGENNVDTVSFVVKRYYNDLDLSTLSYVLYGDSQSNTRASIELEKEVLEDKLTLIWKIQKDFTAVAGTLTLLIKGYNTQKQEVIKFVGRNPIQVKKTDPNGATVVPPESEYDQALEKLYQILEEAKEVSMYPPRIGENDSWEVYNNVLNEYVDTGISVRGAQPKGEWSASATYQKLDIVSYQGSSFAVLKEISGIVPTNDNVNYMLIAQKGDVGKSAYEYAKESGFVGTEQEFAQAQSDILNAKNDVEKVKQEVTLVQTQVNQSAAQVSNDKQAVETARQEVSLKHTEVLEKAEQVKTNAESFNSSVVQAKQEIETSKTNAVQEINRSGETARQSVVAEGTSQTESVTNTGTQAVANVQSKATEQLNLIAGAGTAEVQKVATEGAKQVQAATEQANLAKQSADNAASKAQEVSESVTAGKQEIATAKDVALSAVQSEGGKQVQAVNDAGKAQITSIQGEGTKQSKAVADAGAAQIVAIGNEGQKQIGAVQAEGQKQAEQIKAIESLLPAPTAQDAGKVPMVNAGGDGYELGEVVVDAYTKAESDKRYAPMAVGIMPTASGELVSVNDSAEFGLQGLKIYGKSTQDGVPTPETPVPIVSVGDSGSVEFEVVTKNLFNPAGEIIKQNGKFKVENETGTTISTTTDNYAGNHVTFSAKYPAGKYIFLQNKTVNNQPQKTSLLISIQVATHGYITNAWNKYYQMYILRNDTISQKFVKFEATEPFSIGLVLSGDNTPSGVEIINANNMLQIDVGDIPQFEPHKSQSFPISTPNGLMGTPVKSGGNYTDSKGQQWVCDEIDFARGKWTQRVAKIDNYNGELVGDAWMSSTGQLTTGATVVYQLDKPIEHDLSPELIAAYQKLHTYYPTTNLFASDNAGVEVKYLADTKTYIDNKIQSLTNAVIGGI